MGADRQSLAFAQDVPDLRVELRRRPIQRPVYTSSAHPETQTLLTFVLTIFFVFLVFIDGTYGLKLENLMD